MKILPEHKKFEKAFTLQQDQSDCGVACMLSLVKYYGGTNSLENLRKLSGTNITGTTLLGLYQAASQTGFTAHGCQSDMQGLIDHNRPCILHVVIDDKLEHYVVCFGNILPQEKQEQDVRRFIIGDPGKGIIYLSEVELEKIWKSKACLVLEPNINFKKASDINHEKRKWIIDLIKNDYHLLTITAALGIAIAALGLVMSIFSQRLIDELLPKKEFTKLYLDLGLVFLLLLIKEGFSVLRQYFLIRQGKDFNIRIIDFFFNHLLHLPKPFFDTRKIGEFTARLNDTTRIQRVISQLASIAVIDVLMSIVSTGFIFAYSWPVGIGCLVAMPVFYFLISTQNKKIIETQRSIMVSYAVTEGNYISTLQGIEPIKNYNKQELFAATNKNIYKTFQSNIFSLGKIQISLSFLANAFGVIFLSAVLTFTSYQVLHDHLKTGELIAIIGMVGLLLPGVARLALISIPINEAKIAFDRMFEFTAIEPEKEITEYVVEDFESLQVDNLSFRFAGRRPIIKDISFEVNKGEVIGLMGENGCGKSTIVQVLQKNYFPEGGTIMLNHSVPLNDHSTKAWREIIGVVPQNIHIFNGTVLDNIAFDDTQTNAGDVILFLQQYGLLPFIDSLPQSLMTIIGEEGVNLSGGQKQMIALARALYHKPGLLILDEATGAMDRQSEQFVLQLLNRLRNEMAIIFITHRLHVLKSFCNRIYIIEAGKITNSGDHDFLLQSKNLYSNYWKDLAPAP